MNFLANRILRDPETCRQVAVLSVLCVFRASESHFRAGCTSCEIQCSVSGYRGMTTKSSAWPSNCWPLRGFQQVPARAALCDSVIKRNASVATVALPRTPHNFAVRSCDHFCMCGPEQRG
jgi:hypothetical protein